MSTGELLSVRANLWIGVEATSGQLEVTKEFLQFAPYPWSRHSEEYCLPIKDIGALESFSYFGLVPTGLRVVMTDGTEFNFALLKRNRVFALLESIWHETQGR